MWQYAFLENVEVCYFDHHEFSISGLVCVKKQNVTTDVKPGEFVTIKNFSCVAIESKIGDSNNALRYWQLLVTCFTIKNLVSLITIIMLMMMIIIIKRSFKTKN